MGLLDNIRGGIGAAAGAAADTFKEQLKQQAQQAREMNLLRISQMFAAEGRQEGYAHAEKMQDAKNRFDETLLDKKAGLDINLAGINDEFAKGRIEQSNDLELKRMDLQKKYNLELAKVQNDYANSKPTDLAKNYKFIEDQLGTKKANELLVEQAGGGKDPIGVALMAAMIKGGSVDLSTPEGMAKFQTDYTAARQIMGVTTGDKATPGEFTPAQLKAQAEERVKAEKAKKGLLTPVAAPTDKSYGEEHPLTTKFRDIAAGFDSGLGRKTKPIK